MKNLGKTLAYILRHSPESIGAILDAQGRIPLDTLAGLLDVPVKDIRTVVKEDDKGRYKIQGELIYATQGHSFPVDVPLEEVTPEMVLYHGTLQSSWSSFIKSSGLKKMSRQHVHLSRDLGTAKSVASRRKGETVILRVDTGKALRMGVKFFIAENGVYLSTDIPASCLQIAI